MIGISCSKAKKMATKVSAACSSLDMAQLHRILGGDNWYAAFRLHIEAYLDNLRLSLQR